MKKYFLIVASVLFTSLVFSSCGKTDYELTGDVRTAIQVDAPAVTIEVRNAIATLGGTVESEEAKAEAEKNATAVDGIKRVNNTIEVVVPAPKISQDDILRTMITEEFRKAKVEGIEIAVKDEVVTLTGIANKAGQKKIMDLMKGVKTKKVVNEMKLK